MGEREPEKPRVVITGVSGRMGRMLVEVVRASDAVRLFAVTERKGHPWAGRDLGEALGAGPWGVPVTDDPIEAFVHAQIVLDFTTPEATRTHAALAAQAHCVHVIGTTGLSVADEAAIAAAARHSVVIKAGNMSLGVNLLVEITRRVAQALGPDWDIEVLESHHRHKVDAPSGTALMLGEAVAGGRGNALRDCAVFAREGLTGARPEGAIGFAALRGGDIVGEHDVIFAGPGERVVLRHVATDRTIFARGALKAAEWGLNRPPGQYSMLDVLGV